jgi:hypothetical protein
MFAKSSSRVRFWGYRNSKSRVGRCTAATELSVRLIVLYAGGVARTIVNGDPETGTGKGVDPGTGETTGTTTTGTPPPVVPDGRGEGEGAGGRSGV